MSSDSTASDPAPGLVRRGTWRKEELVPAAVQNFIREYPLEHYEGLAQRANDLIKEALKEAGVQANTQFRAKSKSRLQDKLCKRYSKARYACSDDIRKDIADFAGVRVIMYVPTKDQHAKVKNVIHSIWGKIQPILHPQEDEGRKTACSKHCESCETCGRDRDEEEDKGYFEGNDVATSDSDFIAGSAITRTQPSQPEEEEYQPIHLGYKAYHYRCPMKKEHAQPYVSYYWREDDTVEVQVVSALVHAWAEVGHDVLYKGHTFGKATNQEQLLLDALNGLIQSGDLLLQQFHELVEERTYKKFTYADDLRSCLRKMDILEARDGRPECEGEALDLLFRFLTRKGQNYPLALRYAFEEFGLPEKNTMKTFMEEVFHPKFLPAANMVVSICLIHRMTWKENSKTEMETFRPTKDYLPAECCCIIMKALILIQSFFGGAEPARSYLRELEKESVEERSIDFILTDNFLQEALDQRDSFYSKNQDELRPKVINAWNWFRKQSNDSASICGLAFRLAEMGATQDVGVNALLEKLEIERLSRSSTESEQMY